MSHVFLSYHNVDREMVESIAHKLQAMGVDLFFDAMEILPGERWQERLGNALDSSYGCIVFIGSHGLGPWQSQEVEAALEKRIRTSGFLVIPVLLPGVEVASLPLFLRGFQWVSFDQETGDEEAFRRLVSGLRMKLEETPAPIHDLGRGGTVPGRGSVTEWWRRTFRFGTKYLDWLISRYQLQRTPELKSLTRVAPDLESTFVPLVLVAEVPGKVPASVIGRVQLKGVHQIWDFLAQASSRPSYRRIVITGAPGSGKTTLLEHIALMYALRKHRQWHPQAPDLVPMIVYLRKARRSILDDPSITLSRLAASLLQMEKPDLCPYPSWFERRLRKGRCLVLLDGLDEVANEFERRQISFWVDRQMNLYPKSPFLLTSRPLGYRKAEIESVGLYLALESLDLSQIEHFLRSWFRQVETLPEPGAETVETAVQADRKASDLLRRIKDSSSLSEMAANPLLLNMIATVHASLGVLPKKRAMLYQLICDVLLSKRLAAKGIPDPMALGAQDILQALAFRLTTQQTIRFETDEVALLIREELEAHPTLLHDPESFFKHIEEISGLISEVELNTYQFSHLSFQEYLASVYIRKTGREKFLSGKLEDTWWHEVTRLYASANDSTELIAAILERELSEDALALASECLEEAVSVSPEVLSRFNVLVKDGLESTDPERFSVLARSVLKKNLRRFVRIDNSISIAPFHISCAEYQLFADDQAQEGKDRYPLHWRNQRFPPGRGLEPVTGVTAGDAQAFCVWLSERFPPIRSKYRLPCTAEVGEAPAQQENVHYWCASPKGWVLSFGRDLKELDPSLTEAFGQDCLFIMSELKDRVRCRATDLMMAINETRTLFSLPGIEQNLITENHIQQALDWAKQRMTESGFSGSLAVEGGLMLILAEALQISREVIYDLACKIALIVEGLLGVDYNSYKDYYAALSHDQEVSLHPPRDTIPFLPDQRIKLLDRSGRALTSFLQSLSTLQKLVLLRPAVRFWALVLLQDGLKSLSQWAFRLLHRNQAPLLIARPITDLGNELNHFFLYRNGISCQDKELQLRGLNLLPIRQQLLLASLLNDILAKVVTSSPATEQEREILESGFTLARDRAFKLYSFFLVTSERQAGRASAWEGLRIVRERETEETPQ